MRAPVGLGLVVTLTMVLPSIAHAHPIVVDGDASDWFGTPANHVDLGRVARDALQRGEMVWLDATGDERTDFASPDGQADLGLFAVTADATHVYFLAVFPSATTLTGNGAPMVQVAIDGDGAPGQRDFVGSADTQVSPEAAWEVLVQSRFGSGAATAAIYTPGLTPSPGSRRSHRRGAGRRGGRGDGALGDGPRHPARNGADAPVLGRDLSRDGDRLHVGRERCERRARRRDQLLATPARPRTRGRT